MAVSNIRPRIFKVPTSFSENLNDLMPLFAREKLCCLNRFWDNHRSYDIRLFHFGKWREGRKIKLEPKSMWWEWSKTAETIRRNIKLLWWGGAGSSLLPTTRGRLAAPMWSILEWGQFSSHEFFYPDIIKLLFFHLRIFAYTSVLLLRRPLEMSPKRSLIKSCLGSLRLLAVCLMRLWLWPLKLPAPPSQPLLLSLQGEGWGHYETQWSALRGCLRRELRGTVCISRRSRNPTRHLEEFTRGEGRQRGWRDAVDSCTLLKTVNLEKWGQQQHVHGCVLFFK